MLVLWIFLVAIHGVETKINYDACKKEEFKPKVCERYKKLLPPDER
jgi:hypothetical protein